MSLSRRVKNAVIPWLIYAGATGLVSGVICGVLLLGLNVIFLISSIANSNLLSDLNPSTDVILSWTAFSLEALIFCVIIGFWTGAVSALIGGAAGRWWAFLSGMGLTSLLPSFSRDADVILFIALPLVLLGTVSTKFAADLLEWDAPKFKWDAPIRKRMRGSWLPSPPYFARFCGLLIPIVTGFLIWPLSVLPVFWGHLDYSNRLGLGGIWRNSELMVVRNSHPHWSRSSCQSNLKQIMLGLLQYEQDYDGTYPPLPHSPAQGVAAVIQPYVKSTQLFQCPQDFIWNANDRFSSGDFTDYWYNARLYGVTYSHLKSPMTTLAWGDGNTGAGEANAAYSLRTLPPNFAPATRHSHGANYAFMDGHVKWLTPDQISNTAPSPSNGPTMNP